jgi:hypothetical protein
MSKQVESSVNMEREGIGNGCLGVGIAVHATLIKIPPGGFLVRWDMLWKFIFWTPTPRTVMLLEMMKVTTLMAICKPCCQNGHSTPEVAICAENVLIPAFTIGILVKSDKLEIRRQYHMRHLMVCLAVLIQPHVKNIADHVWNQQDSDCFDAVN